jgi:beta-mannosidase
MPRWPEAAGQRVVRLDGFAADGPPTDAEDRTYARRFASEPLADGEEAVLAFDGVATVFAVELDGVVVLEGRSMFERHEVDVSNALRGGGEHELVIRCRALDAVLGEQPRRPRQRWRTRIVKDARLRFVRTAILGRAPGIAPGPPTAGPWRPVWLVRRRGPVLDDVRLRPRVAGGAGVLQLRATLRAAAGGVLDPALVAGGGTLELDGRSGRHVAPLYVGAGGEAEAQLHVPAVARWAPHTHGEPVLHDVHVLLADGTLLHRARVGFRHLTPGPDHDAARDGLALAVDGVPVFARGAVWTPVREDEIRSTLGTLRDAGLNLVRVPGIGVYEDEAFHDACDELGMLVWQDFMFANLDYPIADDGFRAAVEAEARQVLLRIAGRPSLAVLCGNSEVEQQAAMFGVARDEILTAARGELFGELLPRLAREAGAEVPYLPSAPCGGDLPMHPGTGVDNWFGVGGYRRPLADVRAAGVRFASECLAFANVPDAEVRDGEGVPRDAGADWDFADVRDHYLRELLHVDPAAERAAGRARYLALSRQASGEAMAAVFGEWRRAASPCAGGIVLWARDLRPGAGWGLLDHAGAPKVALHRLAEVLAPVAVWLVDEGLGGVDVHVANDRPEPLRATLRVALLAGGAHAVAEGVVDLDVPGRGTARHGVEALAGRFADAAYAYRFGPPAHDVVVATLERDGELLGQACHFPLGPPAQPVGDLGLLASASPPDTAGAVAVTLTADRLAYGVRVAAAGFTPDRDALTVVPGTPQTVRLQPVSGRPWAGGLATALNLRGAVPVQR